MLADRTTARAHCRSQRTALELRRVPLRGVSAAPTPHLVRQAQHYNELHEAVLESASTFQLGKYWAPTANYVHQVETSYYDMTWNRVLGLTEQLTTDNRDDFMIEKNKCTM